MGGGPPIVSQRTRRGGHVNAVPIALLVEGFIAALLVITIGFCIALYRRLGLLRHEEHRLQATIGDLIEAGEWAEDAIARLSGLAEDAETVLAARTEDAGHRAGELERHVAAAETVLTRIIALSRAVRPDAPRPAVPRHKSGDEEQAA